jgi:hypothetical protein
VSESLSEQPSQSGAVSARPAGRSRVTALIGAVAGATLLVAGVAACGGGSSPAKSSGSGNDTSTTGGKAVPIPKPTAGPLTEPDSIASLQKAADQSVAQDLLHAMQSTAKGAQISAVTYVGSTNKNQSVLVYGGDNLPMPAGSPVAQIKAILKAAPRVGAGSKFGHESKVSAGSNGGVAQCAPVINPGAQLHVITCGWIHGKSALVMSFGGFNPKSARSLVPQIIAAMVKS